MSSIGIKIRRRLVAAFFLIGATATIMATAEPQGIDPPSPAAVIAVIEGEVWITPAGGTNPLPAKVGRRLTEGDEVRTADLAQATIYFSGGHIVRIPGGSRLEIIRDPATDSPDHAAVARISGQTMKVIEDGLWLMSDPAGKLLLAGMRGHNSEASQAPGSPRALSPRNELVTAARPTFYWSHAPDTVKVSVGTMQALVWSGQPVSGSLLSYPESAPVLSPDVSYRWWLEDQTTGRSLTQPVAFRVASEGTLAEIALFEEEITSLQPSGGRPLAGFLRCAYYIGLESWSEVLLAARRLEEAGIDEELARQTVVLAARRMSIRGYEDELLAGLARHRASKTTEHVGP